MDYEANGIMDIYTDGSCLGNPGPGGWAAILHDDEDLLDRDQELSGGEPDTTNNRMELSALVEAYQLLPEDTRVRVYSDSQLCVKTVNEWAAGWERRGWRRKSGPIANLELVQRLYALANAHARVELRWIRAHDGSRWNEYADALACTYMR